ncbi:MAG: hypothetical protein GY773_14145, partial [Actinomycetia bacterium]|nr:hypothetical protein [Actinomycetes bacterium]
MLTSTPVLQTSIRLHQALAVYSNWSAAAADALTSRLDPRDERGDVAPRTIGIAVMATLALSVGV